MKDRKLAAGIDVIGLLALATSIPPSKVLIPPKSSLAKFRNMRLESWPSWTVVFVAIWTPSNPFRWTPLELACRRRGFSEPRDTLCTRFN